VTPYYNEGGITIYHGDCRDVLQDLYADVLITDPPYGLNLGVANDPRGGAHGLGRAGFASYEDTPENFHAIVVPALTGALSRVRRGLVFASGTGVRALPPYQALGGIFLPAGVGRNCWGFQQFSFCAFYGVAPDLHKGARPTGFSSWETVQMNGHPTPKPYGWMMWAVTLASRPGEMILDPFCGSGTTLAAAKQCGRRAIGIELEERYCELAVRRVRQGALPLEFIG
jgi:site-specific DNA-methyltransferase (adenine-specific)